MVKRKVGALEKLQADLPALQYKIRQDPSSYRDDFIRQYGLYESHREIFLQAPSSATEIGLTSFLDLVDFISHVAHCYPTVTAHFPSELLRILTSHHRHLDPELREKIVGSLVLLRRKNNIDSSTLLHAFFPILTSTESKSLRKLLFQKILSDLRTSNQKAKNHRLNRTVQTVLYNLLTSDRSSSEGVWAVKLTRELWKRQIWTDSKAVEIMKEACLADNEKAIVGGVRFFLGGDKEREEIGDESSDGETVDLGRLKHQIGINKKSKKKARAMENAVAQTKKKERQKRQPHPLNFSAFHLLHDPQSFAEALFSKHLQNTRSKLNLEQKLQVLQLVSRLVGLHKLTIISLYSYFLKHLTPRQPSVTSFLASLAQATHSLVPPDVLEPLVQKIANEFVSEAAASPVASAGLNAIREICFRQPLAMNDVLLQDLVMYRKSKDKGVMMAAKGLLSLYRDISPEMLKTRDRGKEAAMGLRNDKRRKPRFGEEATGEIEGLSLLERWKEEDAPKSTLEKGQSTEVAQDRSPGSADSNDDEDGWEVEEDDSDDSGGWIDVESDTDVYNDDSGHDGPPTKKHKLDSSEGNDHENKENKSIDDAGLEKRTSTLATSKILTPADFTKLKELRLEASMSKLLPLTQRRRFAQQQARLNRHPDDPLTATEIEGLADLSKKASKYDKIKLAKEGKVDRSEHKSNEAKRKEKKYSQGKGTTNKEKARKKNFLMTLGKAKGKQKRSLVEKGRILKAHVERGRRGGKRGNKGR